MSDTEETPKSSPQKEPEEEKGQGDSAKPEEHVAGEPEVKELDDSDVVSDREGHKAGLLEQPIMIEGKRQRKKVERLSENISKSMEEVAKVKEKELATLLDVKGKGQPLGEIEFVQFMLNKTKAEDLKLLHRVLYGKIAPQNDIKKNIRKFSGFPFEKDSKEHEKRMDMVNRIFVQPLKEILNILGLEKKGDKKDLVNKLTEFLYDPQPTGKKMPKPKRKSSAKDGKKGKRKPKGEKKAKKSSAKKVTSEEEVASDDDSSGSDDDDDDDPSDNETEEKEPPKKKAKVEKKEAKKEVKKEVKKEKKKPATPKKSTPKKSVKKKVDEAVVDSDSSDSDSDDEPLIKKKKPPTDEELYGVIKKILDGANLEEITMKSVCKQVYAKYPEFDLLPRKSFIKETVKEIIN